MPFVHAKHCYYFPPHWCRYFSLPHLPLHPPSPPTKQFHFSRFGFDDFFGRPQVGCRSIVLHKFTVVCYCCFLFLLSSIFPSYQTSLLSESGLRHTSYFALFLLPPSDSFSHANRYTFRSFLPACFLIRLKNFASSRTDWSVKASINVAHRKNPDAEIERYSSRRLFGSGRQHCPATAADKLPTLISQDLQNMVALLRDELPINTAHGLSSSNGRFDDLTILLHLHTITGKTVMQCTAVEPLIFVFASERIHSLTLFREWLYHQLPLNWKVVLFPIYLHGTCASTNDPPRQQWPTIPYCMVFHGDDSRYGNVIGRCSGCALMPFVSTMVAAAGVIVCFTCTK